MDRNGYNGYTNYETWAVCLWVDNDETLYNDAREMAREAIVHAADDADSPTPEEKEEAVRLLAERMKEWIEEMAPELGATLWSDLLGAALSEVDWHEVASTRF